MKYFYIFLVAVFSLASCTVGKKLQKVDIKNGSTTQNDSVGYELIVFDPGFESWFISHSKPTWYHSQEYYETWNRQYVTEWNIKALNPRYSKYFESTIDYDPAINYGLELNHKLFYYFQYVEKELNIDILPPGSGPHTAF